MSFNATLANYNSKKLLKKYQTGVSKISQYSEQLKKLTDEELKAEFLLISLDNIAQKLYYAFAIAREACFRSLGLFPHDVQMIGGLCLFDGELAEMKTGEGKTLTIVPPAAILSHINKKSVHVVTANSYLATRDAKLMEKAYAFLGLSCSSIFESQSIEDKQKAYSCDIVYGVGHEFGFDYLKDNLVTDPSRIVQKELFAAIVDEVDSILIDEAKTPMIISGESPNQSGQLKEFNKIVKGLIPSDHYVVNIKKHEISVTESGYDHVESALVKALILPTEKALYSPKYMYLLTILNNLLKAHVFFKKDRDYIVENGTVLLVDAGTGRKMYGRRLEEGLHEALEAKEDVFINKPTLAKASISYQNFFRLYTQLSGLTGTALTDADEFIDVYGLVTCVIPTNKPIARVVHPDLLYSTRLDKFNAVISILLEKKKTNPNQPILIGTGSVRDAFVLDTLLSSKGIEHNLLTAANLEKEAEIIANAGAPGAITIATNMAGRGTDILLGGDAHTEQERQEKAKAKKDAIDAGGLFVLVTERSTLRRVDNQFAGRCARQGDPGEVQFLVSLEDDLFMLFGENKLKKIAQTLNLSGGVGGAFVNRFIEKAQEKSERKGFDSREELTKLDAVLSAQQNAIFSLRKHLLNKEDVEEFVENCFKSAAGPWLKEQLQEDPIIIPFSQLKKSFSDDFGINAPFMKWSLEDLTASEVSLKLSEFLKESATTTVAELSKLQFEVAPFVLGLIDEGWTAHLTNLTELQKGMMLKANNGLNPVYQFHKDAFDLFKSFESNLRLVVTQELVHKLQELKVGTKLLRKNATPDQIVALELEKRWICRNEACPCGSGKKFKLCHGLLP